MRVASSRSAVSGLVVRSPSAAVLAPPLATLRLPRASIKSALAVLRAFSKKDALANDLAPFSCKVGPTVICALKGVCGGSSGRSLVITKGFVLGVVGVGRCYSTLACTSNVVVVGVSVVGLVVCLAIQRVITVSSTANGSSCACVKRPIPSVVTNRGFRPGSTVGPSYGVIISRGGPMA